MDSSIDTLLPAFCGITGANLEEGKMFLEMSGADLNRAVSLYYDNSASQAEDVVHDLVSSSEEESEMEEENRIESEVRRIYSSQGKYAEKS